MGHGRTISICMHKEETLHSPLALAGMENQILVVLGADGELMLCWVEDVEQEMTLASAVDRHKNIKVEPTSACLLKNSNNSI